MELFIAIGFSILALGGVCIALIPGVPAMLFLLIVSVLFGAIDGFVRLSQTELLILAGIYLISFMVDVLSGVLGAKYGGASLRSIAIGILGGVLGTIVAPPFGGILGLFLGVLISELLQKKGHWSALRAAGYGVLGVVVGLIINVTLALIFFATFVSFIFFVN